MKIINPALLALVAIGVLTAGVEYYISGPEETKNQFTQSNLLDSSSTPSTKKQLDNKIKQELELPKENKRPENLKNAGKGIDRELDNEDLSCRKNSDVLEGGNCSASPKLWQYGQARVKRQTAALSEESSIPEPGPRLEKKKATIESGYSGERRIRKHKKPVTRKKQSTRKRTTALRKQKVFKKKPRKSANSRSRKHKRIVNRGNVKTRHTGNATYLETRRYYKRRKPKVYAVRGGYVVVH